MADTSLLVKVKRIMYGANPELMDLVTKTMFGYDSKTTATGKAPEKVDFTPMIPDTLGFTQEHVTFTFGRFSVPSVGHNKLFERLKEEAGQGDHIVFATRSHDTDRNPLSFETKCAVMEMCWPELKIYEGGDVRTFFDAVSKLQGMGYKSATLVVGRDRYSVFSDLLERYAADYEMTVGVVAVDRTDDDASATKMRNAVIAEDFDTFASLVPSDDRVLAEYVYNLVAEGLKKPHFAKTRSNPHGAKTLVKKNAEDLVHGHRQRHRHRHERHEPEKPKKFDHKTRYPGTLREAVQDIMNRVPTVGGQKPGEERLGVDKDLADKKSLDPKGIRRRLAQKRQKQIQDEA